MFCFYVHGHLGCFHLPAVTWDAGVSTRGQGFVGTRVLISPGWTARGGVAGAEKILSHLRRAREIALQSVRTVRPSISPRLPRHMVSPVTSVTAAAGVRRALGGRGRVHPLLPRVKGDQAPSVAPLRTVSGEQSVQILPPLIKTELLVFLLLS